MSRRLASLALLLLAGCAGGPAAPDWQANAHAALAAHTAAYLAGRDRVATNELMIARREVARTGAAEPMARVELAACAARFASLEAADCPGYEVLAGQAGEAGAANAAYAAYLAGHWQGLAVDLLPAVQQAVPGEGDALAVLPGIEEPLSRLVAAAALLRAGRLPPAGMAIAIDTASHQGWRRPLLAWLGLERDRLATAGDIAGAAAAQRRMDYVTGKYGQSGGR